MQEVTEARRLLWAWLEGRGTGLMEADPGTWLDEVIIIIIIIIMMIIFIIITITRRGRTGPGGRSTAASRRRPRPSSQQPGTCEPCPASGGSSARSAGKYLTAAENI